MRIGITGWRGFIGSYLKDKIDNPVLFQGDLRGIEEVILFVNSCDRIYHIAGKNRELEGNILSNNLVSTGNMVLACKLKELESEIIFVSSKQVEWNPNSEYGLTKAIEEEIVKRAKKWCIFRVPNVYGVGGRPHYNSVVATFAYQLAHLQEVTINNPQELREFIFIEDLIDELLKPRFPEYISVNGEIMSIGEVYEFLATKLGEHKNLQKCLNYWRERHVSTT